MVFCNLHLHSEYSLLDGGIKIKDLFRHIKSLGQTAVSVTDHGTLGGTIHKYQLARKEGIKFIIGVEAYLVNDMKARDNKTETRYHVVFYAKNLQGYRNLIKLMSEAAISGFYYKPRVDKECLRKYSEGLICTTACMQNDIAQALIAGREDQARSLIQGYIDIFGKENFFFEVANHGIREEAIVSEAYFRMAQELGIKVIFGSDAHYLLESHKVAHEVLLCCQTQDVMSSPSRFRFDGERFHILSEPQARSLFPDHPEIFDNTQALADMCNVELELGKPIFPDFPLPDGETNESYLKKLCYAGFEEKYAGQRSEVLRKRLDYELSVINRMGFAEYMLIVQDVVKEVSKIEGIAGCGRGSIGGSMAAFCLGIHQLEPVGNGLLFERFLNPDRVSLPDIDMDFANRDVAINYVRWKYGSDKVALVGTYGTMAAKMAVKDVSRAYGVHFDEVNLVSKMMLDTIHDSLVIPEVRAFFDKYPQVLDAALINEDVIRHAGVHASGCVWGKASIVEYVPVRMVDDQLVAQYDMHEIEDVGLVKMDFLGLETMNIEKHILDMIKKDDRWLQGIPLDDKQTYEMMCKGDVVGCFQLSSQGMIDSIKKIKPTCFNDVVAVISLYRPGSMDYVDVYARRKNGEEEIVYDHPKLEPILKETMGICIYQESLMFLVRELAGFTMAQSDTLRRGVGKKKIELILSLEKSFREGCKNHSGMADSHISMMWDKILKFADYSFNKSHGCEYALSAYRTAYLKCHYPVQFMTAMINSGIGDMEKVVFYLREAKRMGIKVLPADINLSEANFSTDGGAIRFGLEGIKNVSGVSLESIMVNRPYKSYVDFVNKVDVTKVNKRVQKHLIMAGAFDTLGVHRNQLLAGYVDIVPIQKTDGVQMTLFGTASAEYNFPNRHEPTLKEKMDYEKESMGITASGDAMELYPGMSDMWITSKDLNGRVSVFGIVKSVRKVYTKKDSREMAFATIYNDADQIDIVIFPNTYAVYSGALYEDAGLIVTGNLQNGSILADIIELVKPKEE